MSTAFGQEQPAIVPPLDRGFRPLVLANRGFRARVEASGAGVPLSVAVERQDGTVSRIDSQVFSPEAPGAEEILPMLSGWSKPCSGCAAGGRFTWEGR